MRTRGIVVCLLLLTCACTHRQVVVRNSGLRAFEDANRAIAWKDGELLTRSGEVFRWYDIRFRPDSTFGIPLAAGLGEVRRSIPTDRVAEVTVRSRSRGVLDGVLVGTASGFVLGLIVGPPDQCGGGDIFCSESRTTQAAYSGLAGAFWGAIIGAIRSSRTKVEIR